MSAVILISYLAVLTHYNVAFFDFDFGDPRDLTHARLVFQENTRYYSRQIADKHIEGYIDRNGEFVPVAIMDTDKWWFPRTMKPLMPFRNGARVYEYRSGVLVPGFAKGGLFVPDAEGVIIPFENYSVFRSRVPIYNLPGRFGFSSEPR